MEATLLDVQRQVYRLKNLSEAVLTLQGLSQTPANVARVPVDIQTVIEAVTVDLQPLMELKDITLCVQASENVYVTAMREHLLLLLRNLLDNAVKHSTKGSSISLTCFETTTGSLMRLVNPSSHKTQLAGNGLGLRICGEIARVNAWHLRTSEENETFIAEVRFS